MVDNLSSSDQWIGTWLMPIDTGLVAVYSVFTEQVDPNPDFS